jgi:hypothetical protein
MGLIGDDERVKIKRRRRKKKTTKNKQNKSIMSTVVDISSQNLSYGSYGPKLSPAQHESVYLNNKLTSLAIENAKNAPMKQIEDSKLHDTFKTIGNKLLEYDNRFGTIEDQGKFVFNTLYDVNNEIGQLKNKRTGYIVDEYEDEFMKPTRSPTKLASVDFAPQTNVKKLIQDAEEKKYEDAYFGRPLHLDEPSEPATEVNTPTWKEVPTPAVHSNQPEPGYLSDPDEEASNKASKSTFMSHEAHQSEGLGEPEPQQTGFVPDESNEPKPEAKKEKKGKKVQKYMWDTGEPMTEEEVVEYLKEQAEPDKKPEEEPVKTKAEERKERIDALKQKYKDLGGKLRTPVKMGLKDVQGLIHDLEIAQRTRQEYADLGGTRTDILTSENPEHIKKFIFIQRELNEYIKAGGKDVKVLNSTDISKIQRETKALNK